MKKTVMLMLTLIFLMFLAACNRSNKQPVEPSDNTGITPSAIANDPSEIVDTVYQGPLSNFTCIEDDGSIVTMEIPDVEHEQILSILNGGEWINDIANCAHDYEFTAGNASIRYHSECGTFVDMTSGRSRALSETEKMYINEMLGA